MTDNLKKLRRRCKNKLKQLRLLISKYRVGVDENNCTVYSFPNKTEEDKFNKVKKEHTKIFTEMSEQLIQYSKDNKRK
jgi:hypothetical protein